MRAATMLRYGRAWAEREGERTAVAYVPLIFAPGEAYQFDWSQEIIWRSTLTWFSTCPFSQLAPGVQAVGSPPT
jgi:hypothetical protein